MKILERYLLREFLLYLALGLIGFIVIFAVVDVFEKIDVFLDNRAHVGTVARFYMFRAPEVVVQVMPVALLLATFLALGQLNKFGELTAMRVAGQSLVRILAPVWWVAATCTLAALLLGELVVPGANRERYHIYNEQIQGIVRAAPTERADVAYLGRGGRIYLIRLYVVPERRMHQVSMQEFRQGRLARRIDASDALWEGGRWVFRHGVVRNFVQGREQVESFAQLVVPGLEEKPDDFAKEQRNPAEMSFFELHHYIERLRASGSRVANYLVDLHLKLAFPFVNLIVVAIGASIATRLRMQSAAQGFGLSVVIAFLFYALMRTSQALGHNGALPPYLAAWLTDLLFGGVGAVMLAHAQRR